MFDVTVSRKFPVLGLMDVKPGIPIIVRTKVQVIAFGRAWRET